MRVVYTYEGERDPSFEDAMLGVVGDLGPARQLASVAAVNGVRAVTLEVTPAGGDRPSGDPTEDLVRRLRAHERVVDVTPEGSDRLY